MDDANVWTLRLEVPAGMTADEYAEAHRRPPNTALIALSAR